MVIDTNILIELHRKEEEVRENITVISVIEFPPILRYEKFHGEIYTIKPEDQILAIKLQRRLRRLGKPKSVPDLLIAAICINRNEELLTKDEDFLEISKVSELKLKVQK